MNLDSLYETDLWTRRVIPVERAFSVEAPIAVQVFVDGILDSCNHASTNIGEIETQTMVFDETFGNYLPKDDKELAIVCDKCGAYKFDDDSNEWIN